MFDYGKIKRFYKQAISRDLSEVFFRSVELKADFKNLLSSIVTCFQYNSIYSVDIRKKKLNLHNTSEIVTIDN